MDIHKMIHNGDAGISQLLDNKMHVKVKYEKTSRHEERYTLKNEYIIANGNADHDVMIEVINEMMKMLIKLSILITEYKDIAKENEGYKLNAVTICNMAFTEMILTLYSLRDIMKGIERADKVKVGIGDTIKEIEKECEQSAQEIVNMIEGVCPEMIKRMYTDSQKAKGLYKIYIIMKHTGSVVVMLNHCRFTDDQQEGQKKMNNVRMVLNKEPEEVVADPPLRKGDIYQYLADIANAIYEKITCRYFDDLTRSYKNKPDIKSVSLL